MNENIDITKISIRRLIKLTIKDYDRGDPEWNIPLQIRGVSCVYVRQCHMILKSKYTNRQISRMAARARQCDKVVTFPCFMSDHKDFPKYQFADAFNAPYLKIRIDSIEDSIRSLELEKSKLTNVLDTAQTTFQRRKDHYYS